MLRVRFRHLYANIQLWSRMNRIARYDVCHGLHNMFTSF